MELIAPPATPSPSGWKRDYERALKALQEARLAAIVPFLKFNEFPKELRQLIWKHSLPRPRTICPGDPRDPKIQDPPDSDDFERYQNELTQMVFPKEHHTPTPQRLVFAVNLERSPSRDIDCVSVRQMFMQILKSAYFTLVHGILLIWKNSCNGVKRLGLDMNLLPELTIQRLKQIWRKFNT
jgi:hypothetical protein